MCCWYYNDISTLSAFKTYVRPIVEYNSVVWNPFLIKDITTLEVQRVVMSNKTSNILPALKQSETWKSGIKAFAYRFIVCVQACVWHARCKCGRLFITDFNNARRGHCYRLYLPSCKSSIRYSYFRNRVIRVWNNLPKDVDFTSYGAFKQSLTGVILCKFCKVYFM